MKTFANSENQDEMQHNTAFSRLHFIRVYTVCKVKKNTMVFFFENYNLAPLKLYNGLSKVDCIKSDGLIHYYTKG